MLLFPDIDEKTDHIIIRMFLSAPLSDLQLFPVETASAGNSLSVIPSLSASSFQIVKSARHFLIREIILPGCPLTHKEREESCRKIH